MIWMDRRAEEQSAALAKAMSPEEFYRNVGANLDSSHAVFKALWVRDEEPELWKDAATLMSPGTYALRSVSGVTAVDYSNASSLALLDPRSRTWSEPVLDATGIDRSMLPELAAGTQPVGAITAAFAEATGLSPSTQVAVGCGDEMAATLGAGVFSPGEVCDVVGTAEPVCAASAEPREDPTMLVECHPHADPDAWLLENPGFVSGGNLRWWRDQFAPIERSAEAEGLGDAYDFLSKEASTVPAGAEGLVFLPCMQGAMAPEWNGAARGVFYGLTLAHTRDHMTRSILEGSAFALRDILSAMRDAGLDVRRLTIVGGGAKGALWRQIKADVTGLPVRVPSSVETTATGAAIQDILKVLGRRRARLEILIHPVPVQGEGAAAAIAATGRNERYLPAADLTGVGVTTIGGAAVARADVVVVAVGFSALVGVVFLSLWSAAHRLRITLYDIGVRADTAVATAVYSTAGLASIAAAAILFRL